MKVFIFTIFLLLVIAVMQTSARPQFENLFSSILATGQAGGTGALAATSHNSQTGGASLALISNPNGIIGTLVTSRPSSD